MIRAIGCEILKLRRSLVLLVAATPAVMVYLLGVLAMTSGQGAGEWTVLVMAKRLASKRSALNALVFQSAIRISADSN